MTDSLALSALDWWETAGVDLLVDEAPRDWLAPPAAAPASVPVATAPALPATLAAFRAWLLADVAVPGPPAHRLDAAGDPACGTMIVVDMPEPDDRATGALLAGATGALFDRMLGAIGLGRDAIYLAPLAPARPTGGRLDAAACATLGRLMRHHIALAAPRRLLLLGDAPARALLELGAAEARGRTHAIEGVPTIVSLHPRFVSGPAARKAAWDDLQAFQALA